MTSRSLACLTVQDAKLQSEDAGQFCCGAYRDRNAGEPGGVPGIGTGLCGKVAEVSYPAAFQLLSADGVPENIPRFQSEQIPESGHGFQDVGSQGGQTEF